MLEAKLLMPVKFTEAAGSWARPKKDRKLAYSPNCTLIDVADFPAIVELRDWVIWAARTAPSTVRMEVIFCLTSTV